MIAYKFIPHILVLSQQFVSFIGKLKWVSPQYFECCQQCLHFIEKFEIFENGQRFYFVTLGSPSTLKTYLNEYTTTHFSMEND